MVLVVPSELNSVYVSFGTSLPIPAGPSASSGAGVADRGEITPGAEAVDGAALLIFSVSALPASSNLC